MTHFCKPCSAEPNSMLPCLWALLHAPAGRHHCLLSCGKLTLRRAENRKSPATILEGNTVGPQVVVLEHHHLGASPQCRCQVSPSPASGKSLPADGTGEAATGCSGRTTAHLPSACCPFAFTSMGPCLLGSWKQTGDRLHFPHMLNLLQGRGSTSPRTDPTCSQLPLPVTHPRVHVPQGNLATSPTSTHSNVPAC